MPELGGGVIGLAEIADEAGRRGEVDERSAFLFAEQPGGGVGDVERAHQVHLDDLFEGVDAHAVEDHVAQNAGIVHHAVELAVGIGRHLDDLAGRDRFRDALEIRDRGAAALLDFLDHFLGRCG